MVKMTLMGLAGALLLSGVPAKAQEDDYDPITEFPSERHDEVAEWLWKAETLQVRISIRPSRRDAFSIRPTRYSMT